MDGVTQSIWLNSSELLASVGIGMVSEKIYFYFLLMYRFKFFFNVTKAFRGMEYCMGIVGRSCSALGCRS